MDAESPFYFDGYEVGNDRKSLFFRYQLKFKGILRSFREEIRLPQPIPADVSEALLTVLMQNLLLVLGLSYWKATCSREMKINGFSLSQEQAVFWDIVYTKGMGELFYRNNLNFKDLVRFPSVSSEKPQPTTIKHTDIPLLGIAGGKDSLLSSKLLQRAGITYTGMVVEKEMPFPLIDEVLPYIQAPFLRIKRIIDPQLYELNKQGAYNGHIPISAIYAFLGFAVACLYGYSDFIVSNEKSANYGNVNYLGMEVNHQWSKSEEFEQLFQSYARNITADVSYFSLLRPLNELQITKRFVRYEDLLPHFSSCNRNFKIHGEIQQKKWCGECPKCAFVFALLSAFLPEGEVTTIFGKNLYEDEGLIPTYRQLLGIVDFKPFECVGTPEEVRVAMYMAYNKHGYDATSVMKMFANEASLSVGIEEIMRKELTFSGQDKLPERYRPTLTINET